MEKAERIDLEIQTDAGYKLSFVTVGDLLKWIEDERAIWSELQGRESELNIDANAKNTLLAPMNAQINLLGVLEGQVNIAEDASDLKMRIDGQINQIERDKYVIASSDIGKYVIDKSKKDLEIGYSILYLCRENIPGLPNNPQVLLQQLPRIYMPIFKGYVDYRLFKAGIRANLNIEKEIVDELIGKCRDEISTANKLNEDIKQMYEGWDSTLDSIKNKKTEAIDSQIAKTKEDLNNLQAYTKSTLSVIEKETEGRLGALEKLYNSKLILRAPVSYWFRKRIAHLVVAGIFGFVFFAVTGYAFFHLLVELPMVFDMVKGMREASAAGLLVTVGMPAFIFVWMLRVIARIFIQNLSYSADANERVAMIRTFLALMQESDKVTEEDRILILQALFRTSSMSGTDDAVPPNWFDILLTRIKT